MKPIRLLLVDDQALFREGIRTLLSTHAGLEIVGEAGNGQEALDCVKLLRPDVILMDINLPGLSGIEAMKLLREDPLTVHIPVVALSANAMQSDIEKGLQAGFFWYLTKPIKVTEFMDVLDVALEFAEIFERAVREYEGLNSRGRAATERERAVES